MPADQPIIDTMIGFPINDPRVYDFIKAQTKDKGSDEMKFPAEYMFKNVPRDLYSPDDDPIEVLIAEMDRHNIKKGLIGVGGKNTPEAIRRYPPRSVHGLP